MNELGAEGGISVPGEMQPGRFSKSFDQLNETIKPVIKCG